MTWHAPDGLLTLSGVEADLFSELIMHMTYLICQDDGDADGYVFGGPKLFDQMTRSQQFASLEIVSRYLFHRTERPLDLTAWSEATLASILSLICNAVLGELEQAEEQDDVGASYYRSLVLDVLDEEWEDSDPWDDPETWEYLLGDFEERYLWDNDYEADLAADSPPDNAEHQRQFLGIDRDYFASIPPDVPYGWDPQQGCKQMLVAMGGV